MKKLLRFLFLLLLLWLWFLYVIKNPSLPISQKILTTFGNNIQTGTQQTGIDLSGCLSYFDGCNTCTVVSGQVGSCTELYCDTQAEPECLEYVSTGMDLTWSEITGSETTWTEIEGTIQETGNQTTYTNAEYWLSFSYPTNRELHTEAVPSWDQDCSAKLNITLIDPSKPLQCFDAGCTPNIKPSIIISIRRTTSCQRFSSGCSNLDANFQNTSGQAICQQLMSLWIPEDTAARTISLVGRNWTDYKIVKGDYWYMVKWSFVDGIVNTTRAFLIEKNWYGVKIFDDAWMYGDVFDALIKTFNYN